MTSEPAKIASNLPSAHLGYQDAYRSTSAEQQQAPQIGTGEDERQAAGLTVKAVLMSESPEQLYTSHSSGGLKKLHTDALTDTSQPPEMSIRCCC